MDMKRSVSCHDWVGCVLSWIVVSMLFPLAGCGKSLSSLSSLARAGQIDSAAPVRAKVQIVISAPPAKIWALLVDAQNWPAWNSHIQHVDATGPLRQGMVFTWETDGTKITSKVQLAETNQRLAWTGTALTAKAVHVWELVPGPGAETVVRVQESMDGPLMAHFLSSTELADTDMQWLTALRAAAEQSH